MRTTRETEVTTRPARICSNEGCGRPADGSLCENCALERSLFHREERQAPRRAEVRTG